MSFADVPGMGCYFFSYEWILSKITLEGERYTQYTEVISPLPLEILQYMPFEAGRRNRLLVSIWPVRTKDTTGVWIG